MAGQRNVKTLIEESRKKYVNIVIVGDLYINLFFLLISFWWMNMGILILSMLSDNFYLLEHKKTEPLASRKTRS